MKYIQNIKRINVEKNREKPKKKYKINLNHYMDRHHKLIYKILEDIKNIKNLMKIKVMIS